MSSQQQSLIIGATVALALVVGVVFWIDSAPSPSSRAAPPPASALPGGSIPRGSAAEATGTATARQTVGTPEEAPSQPSAVTASPAAAADEGLRVYTEAELALPPIVPDPPGTDPCGALRKDQESLELTTNLLAKLPEVNKNTLGAARLRAMHTRLEESVARRKIAVATTGCPEQ